MISYEAFYKTSVQKGLSEYYITYKLSTKMLDEICFVLDCRVEDVLKYKK